MVAQSLTSLVVSFYIDGRRFGSMKFIKYNILAFIGVFKVMKIILQELQRQSMCSNISYQKFKLKQTEFIKCSILTNSIHHKRIKTHYSVK